jgi:hypothetical protein
MISSLPSPISRRDRLALTFGGSRSLDEITADQERRFAAAAGKSSLADRRREIRSAPLLPGKGSTKKT